MLIRSHALQFEYKEVITYPVDQVFPLLRDKTTALVPYLPNVVGVERVLTEELDNGNLHTIKAWTGTPASVPSVIRPFIAPDQLKWLDHAEWNNEECSVEWRFETTTFTELYVCGGKNYVRDLGDGTCQLHIAGHLTVQGDKLPGVPRLLGRKLAPTIEKWVVGNVTPNIACMPTACQTYLDSL